MLISKEIILLQLFNKVGGEENTFFPKNQTTTYRSLGHYDWVSIFSCQSSSALISQSTKNQRINFEKLILIPASDEMLKIDAFFGVVSFISIDEEQKDPFEIAQLIEREFKTDYQSIKKGDSKFFPSKAFVSTGTFSVAVISFCDDPKHVVNWLNTYNAQLQNCCFSNRKTCIYSFSIPLVNTSKTDKDKNENVFYLLNESKEKFPAISFRFARNFEDTRVFYKFIDDFIGALSVPRDNIIKGTINGVDDYQIVAKEVPSESFFSLFSPGEFMNPQDGKGDIPYYESPYTTILLPNKDQGNYFLNDYQQNNITWSDIKKQDSPFYKLPELSGVRCYYDTFIALEQSRFTKWVYSIYDPFITLLEKLIQEHMNWMEDIQDSLKDSISFFTAMFEMIESLLSTSSNYTRSPGFTKNKINIAPRLILSYQSMLQHYAEYWNTWENLSGEYPKRTHLFLLTPHMGKDLHSETFFCSLPPGERLVKIKVPIIYALRPITCLPVLFHEIGHYIGVRHRNTGRLKSFLTLVIQFINQSISMKFKNLDIDESPDPDAKRYDFNDVLSGDYGTSKQKFIFSNLTLLLFEFGKVLHNSLSLIYEDIKNTVVEECEEEIINSKDDIIKAVLKREKNAIENNFFSAVVPAIKEILKQTLGKEFLYEFLKDIESRFSDVIGQKNLPRTMIEAAEKQLVCDFQLALEDILLEIERQDQHRNFIKKSGSILSEVAADIFMVKTLEMSGIDYLLLHFEVNLVSHGEVELRSFIERFGSGEIDNLRILAVYSVLEKGTSEVALNQYIEKYLGTSESEIIDTSKKLSLFNSFKDNAISILEEYKKIENDSKILDENEWKNEAYSAFEMAKAMNPFYGVHEYAKQLYEDDRYHDSDKKSRDLRELYQQAKEEIMNESGVSDLYENLLRLAYQYTYQQRTKVL